PAPASSPTRARSASSPRPGPRPAACSSRSAGTVSSRHESFPESQGRPPVSGGGSRRLAVGLFFVVSALLAGLLAYMAYARYQGFAHGPLSGIEEGDTLLVERGDSFLRVLDKLREAGVRDGHRTEWQLLARRLDAGGRLQVGEYALEPGMSATDLLLMMREGRVIRHRFTIVEGWNIRELRAALATATPLLQETGDLDDAALMAALDRPGVHPEGRFLPE